MENESNFDSIKEAMGNFYRPLPKESLPDKKEIIDNWNNQPEVKNYGVKAVNKTKYAFLQILSVIGIIGILVIGGVFAYLAYQDGTLLSSSNLFCGNTNVTVEATQCQQCQVCSPIPTCPNLPSIPACPDCNVRTYCGNTTE